MNKIRSFINKVRSFRECWSCRSAGCKECNWGGYQKHKTHKNQEKTNE